MPLSDPALEAILQEWNPAEYDPPNSDIREWIYAIESLSDTYGVPDAQRPQCAVKFVKDELRIELERVLEDARNNFGPIHWAQFIDFMIAFDRSFLETWETLPFYKKHPKFTGAALGITGGILLAPIAAIGALTAVGFTTGGIAAGSLAATIQSIVYGGATGGLFSLLQSAGAAMVLPSVGTVFAGAATTGAGVMVSMAGESVTSELLSSSIADNHPNSTGDNDDPPSQAEFVLTPQTIQAIVKSWNITPYNPPGLGALQWLNRVHRLCQRYEVPDSQRALCAMHHMRADCQEAAYAANCYDMTWDQFKTWLNDYDDTHRRNANRRVAELLANQEPT